MYGLPDRFAQSFSNLVEADVFRTGKIEDVLSITSRQ